MEQIFIDKKIKRVLETFSPSETMPLSANEQKILTDYVCQQYKEQSDEDLHTIIYDCCYSIFTGTLTFDEIASLLKAPIDGAQPDKQ
ncbi:YqzH family protein [Halalkalibacterium halodurans]|jgi:hypothetical protein|uniref:BH1507 protein n=1 Tax=Halalkalibacterium halodurans (strain ATCC BAA-125 / DSM 18197 / FERM 7344 / JCM 9153 / C-125) TaxID=272558 RepID=Q9KCR2_HALH5|nr:hypothetical protein E2L07_08365 [Halalkalibacterium halodurans]TPE70442.1 hypothetical protein AMD02_002415 [Halalkalibacterium halodurans]BAB05226.1 BH1507 [Halalkalibacterium halodurans C-125]